MRANYFVSVFTVFILFMSPITFSYESQSLFDLSLEELLNVTVSVASPDHESVIETPAIVSKYTKNDMEAMGITNLKEMFNFIPGVVVQSSLTGFASVQIRGIDEAFNQKVLFLLDGVPYHQPSHSLIPIEGVPWGSILHVEVIRGPGAVFHGTQASGGVFNVVTKNSLEANSAAIKLGKNELVQGNVFLNTQLNNGGLLNFAAEIRTGGKYTESYEQVFANIGVIKDDVSKELEKKSALLNYQLSDFKAQFHAFSDKTIGINDGYADLETLQPFIMESDAYLLHLENSWFTDKATFKVYGDYNHYTFSLRINNNFGAGSDAIAQKDDDGEQDYRARVGAALNYNYNAQWDIALGAEHETRSVGNYGLYLPSDLSSPLVTLFEEEAIDELSAYSQATYTSGNWRFHVGARFTDNELSGSKVTPRFAFIYKLDEHQSIKLLYSTGFNSPNPTQTSINLPGNVVGNSELTAEVVKATDIAYSYTQSNFLFVANIYHLQAEDFIVRRFSEPLDSVSFFNENEYERTGAELDLQYVENGFKSFVNFSFANEGNSFDIDDLGAYRIPKYTASVGSSYTLSDSQTIGGNLSYIGERRGLDAYSLLNMNYTIQYDRIDISLIAKNLLDEKIQNPDISSQSSQLVALGDKGVHLHLGLKTYF